jgi:hypothetical protein
MYRLDISRTVNRGLDTGKGATRERDHKAAAGAVERLRQARHGLQGNGPVMICRSFVLFVI